ncbi:hypothetical protein A1O3_00233 [Capronia epimyces CBS 606.96]|uniref:Uncharacterized protein n=1 Tax=Capronia epimyces CBS 606.96 TaxID=1182542 RepID=W9YGK5_9EURO|nr:uncharacterized protein A1O3_00233 [Capronia epimyces CBS 606.96]EXJ91683.1 hypothetical protein A1O3_00233 [Capronia epimyces CBS 606.96]
MAVALRTAAPLKPEIRLAQTLSEFESILSDSQKLGLRAYKNQTAPETTDVMRLTAEIDRNNGRRRSRRCVGPRFSSILQAVQQFSTIVDTIVGGSQSLLASAIWGVLKMTLQITSSFTSYFENLSVLFMNIGRTCPRFQEFGSLYPRSQSLQRALCEYFIVVVELCMRAVLFIKKPFLSQISSAILAPFHSEFGSFEVDLARLANVIRDEVSLAAKQEQSLEVKENLSFRTLSAKLSEGVALELEKLRRLRYQQRKSELLNACSVYNHETAWRQARKSGTSTWIFQQDLYKQCIQSSESSVLWCTGIVGSGKTVLSANVVENTVMVAPAAVVSYFLCRYDETESLKAKTVVGSLVRQLLSSLKPETFDTVDSIHTNMLDTEQVMDLLEKLLPVGPQFYFIIIDGLDECPEDESETIFKFIRTSLTWKHVFHVFFTSRPDLYHKAFSVLPQCHHIPLPDSNPEIEMYIESALEERLESGMLRIGDPTIILSIQDALLKGSQGMFLWVVFQLDSICSQATDEDILAALKSLPKDLPETFSRIIRKLDQSNAASTELYKKMFEVVAAAQRPLTVEELREAVSVVPGVRSWQPQKLVNDMLKVLYSCGSLLVVDEECSTVHFAHHSVKQFFLSDSADEVVRRYHVDASNADLSLGEVCVTYLNFEVFGMQLEKINNSAFPELIHLPSVVLTSALPQSIVTKLAIKLLRGRERRRYDWKSQLDLVGRSTEEQLKPHPPGLVTCYELWCDLVDDKLSYVDLPWSPVDLPWSPYLNLDILGWVAENEHGALLHHLLQRTLEIPTNSHLWDLFRTGSQSVLLNTLFGLLTVRALSFNADAKSYGLAVILAAQTHKTEYIPSLLEKGSDAQRNVVKPPRLPFAVSGSLGARKPLLSPDNPLVNSTDSKSWTALMWVAAEGDLELVRLLLSQDGIDVRHHTTDGTNALSLAIDGGHLDIARLLLEQVDYAWDDVMISKILLSAAERGTKDIVTEMLTRTRVDINSRDPDGSTPLSRAVISQNEGVVNALLEYPGIDVNARDSERRTPLMSTIQDHPFEYSIVDALLSHPNIDVNAKNNEMETPLMVAIQSGRFKHLIVDAILSHPNIDVNAKDNAGETPLMVAIRYESYKQLNAIDTLLSRPDIDVNAKNKEGMTALLVAVSRDRRGVLKQRVEQLVEKLVERPDVDLLWRDNSGRSAKAIAESMRHKKLIQLIESAIEARYRAVPIHTDAPGDSTELGRS